MTSAVRVEGAKEAALDYLRWSGALEHAVIPGLGKHANKVAGRLRSTVPRRTGALASSIHVESDPHSATLEMGTDHAQYVEHGGRGFPRSSTGNYMGPAVRALEPQLIVILRLATEASIRGFPWSR